MPPLCLPLSSSIVSQGYHLLHTSLFYDPRTGQIVGHCGPHNLLPVQGQAMQFLPANVMLPIQHTPAPRPAPPAPASKRPAVPRSKPGAAKRARASGGDGAVPTQPAGFGGRVLEGVMAELQQMPPAAAPAPPAPAPPTFQVQANEAALRGVLRVEPGQEGWDAWYSGGGGSPVWLGRFPFAQGAAAAVDMVAIKVQGTAAQVG